MQVVEEKSEHIKILPRTLWALVTLAISIPVFMMLNPDTYMGSLCRFAIVYLCLLLLLNIFKTNKIARFFLKILWIPGILLITFYPFLLAILSVVLSFGAVYILAVFIFEIIPLQMFHYHLTEAVRVYLEITISALVVAYFYDKVVGIGDYIFFRNYADKHRKLSLKIMNQSRAKFSLYFLYFIALFILNITRLNGHPVITSLSLEKAILESFATFLAFERIISNWKFFMDEKTSHAV